MEAHREKGIALANKQRGILKSMLDVNYRLMRAGYNKLVQEYQIRTQKLRVKLKFVISALSDSDANFKMTAYNQLKHRAQMLNGIGCEQAEMKKIQMIRMLTNQGYSMQRQSINKLKEFLASERQEEDARNEYFIKIEKEKERILRRIMDSNLRLLGTGFRQALQFTMDDRDRERI